MRSIKSNVVRTVGLDLGRRRVGIAISDASGTLARPLTRLDVHGLGPRTLDAVVAEIGQLREEEDGVGAIVVGLPRHLDGSPNELTARVEAFADALAARMHLPVKLQDERLSSHEANERLSAVARKWQERKARLDASAAAVMLQDYLDAQ